MGLRLSQSVDKDGNPEGLLDENGDTIRGLGWFPAVSYTHLTLPTKA